MMESIRKLKFKAYLKKTNCLREENYWQAGYYRYAEKYLDMMIVINKKDINEFLEYIRINLSNFDSEFIDDVHNFENDIIKEDRKKKIEKLSKII